MAKLCIGFVGFGRQAATNHARYLVANCADIVRIAAIGDVLTTDLPFVHKHLELLGISDTFVSTIEDESDIESTESVEKLLAESPGLDAMIISTPHAKHFPQARACLGKKLHILVDKPPALTYEQGKQLVELTTAPGSPYLVVSSQRRYEKVYQYAKQVIKNGELGEIISVDSIISRSPHLPDWRNDPARSGGGVLWQYAWHSIDTVVYLIDRKARSVDATLSSLKHAPVETYASVLVRFPGDLALTLTANLGAPKGAVYERLHIWGTRGMLLLERSKPVHDTQPPVIIHQTLDGRVLQPDLAGAVAKKWGPTEAFVRLLLALQDSQDDHATADPSVVSTMVDSLETLRIIDAIYSSARLGCRIDLPE